MPEWSASDNPATRMAIDATLLREQQALRGFVRGLVGDAEQARDITQDVFMVAWRAAKECAAPFTPGALWLFDSRNNLWHYRLPA